MRCIVVYEIEKFGELLDLSRASRLTRNHKILISSNEKQNTKLKIQNVYASWECVKGFSTSNRYSITIVVLKKKKKETKKKKEAKAIRIVWRNVFVLKQSSCKIKVIFYCLQVRISRLPSQMIRPIIPATVYNSHRHCA